MGHAEKFGKIPIVGKNLTLYKSYINVKWMNDLLYFGLLYFYQFLEVSNKVSLLQIVTQSS